MTKNLLVILLCLSVAGCATNPYTGIYTTALKTQSSTTINKEGEYQLIKEKVTGYLESRGYSKLIFADPKKKFFVFEKEGDFGEPCQIILQFTQKAQSDKVRIDLVKGSDDLITDSQVADDIQEIADQIKNY